MFIELMPLLGERTVMLTVARIDKNRIRVNVIPTRKREDENAALCAPFSFSGTPEEVDGEMARNLGCVRRGKSAAPTRVGGGEGRDGRRGDDRT
jgi:PRTRC genetic system protein E